MELRMSGILVTLLDIPWSTGKKTGLGQCWSPRPARHSVFLAIWRLLQFLPDEQRQESLLELRSWANAPAAVRPTHRQLSPDEAVELIRGDLFEAVLTP